MVNINAIVCPAIGYGVVVAIFQHGSRTLASVYKIDPTTGDLMQCPDDRCGGKSDTCPIHSVNVDLHTLTAFPARDINYYVSEGLLSPALARKALAPVLRVERRFGSNKFTVKATAFGVSNSVLITETSHPEAHAMALRCCTRGEDTNPGVCIGFTLSDCDSVDYRVFAGVFTGPMVSA